MKLQHLILIFLVIMLPMALIMSQYTGLQIDTLATKTKYDTALLGATFDTMAAFELNTVNNDKSSVIGEEIRDLEAVISTFATSLSTSLNLSGASNDYILSRVPAIVFGLYDGYYIYSQNDTNTGRELKPYVYYTKTYTNGNNTNITISFSLDNYVSIYGTYNGKTISEAGYLVVPDDVEVSGDFTYIKTKDENGDVITKVIDAGTESEGKKSWIKYKEYDITPETIYENKPLSNKNGAVKRDQERETTDAMMYYYEAKKFTTLYNEVVNKLNSEDKAILKIGEGNDPESEESPFMNEKIDVIKNSMITNLNKAIYNYEGGVSETYEMPQLTGVDWEKILNNISIIAFLKDIPIGATSYNNYVVVNSTTNQKYNSAKAIDFIRYQKNSTGKRQSDGYYHKITCEDLINTMKDNNENEIIGYPSVGFERYRYSPEKSNDYFYYYKHNEYADYECEVESVENENVYTMEKFLENKSLNKDQKSRILIPYYTAVGRIRYELVKASSYINLDKEKTFTVTYHAGAGMWTDGTDSEQKSVETKIGRLQIISETPKIIGESFIGWTKDLNGTQPEIKPGDTIYLEEGKTLHLYAVYANEYVITYDPNDGQWSDGTNNQIEETKIGGIAYKISSKTPTRQDHVFLGWSKNPNGPVEYKAGQEFEEDESTTLYAVWSHETVKIEYITASGMNGEMEEVEKGTEYTIKDIGISYDGKIFLYWRTIDGKQYSPGDKYIATENLKLSAVYEDIIFKITYDANEGELPYELKKTFEKTYGLPYYIEKYEPSRSGYIFKGWSENSNAQAADANYAPGNAYTLNRDLTLYAVWEGETYSIVYDANEGENAPQTQTAKKYQDITITNSKPTREGYDFIGWSTKPSPTEDEKEYDSGDTYKERTSVTLYAVWKLKEYTITYNANGGSPEPDKQTKLYEEDIRITSQRPSRDNYYFESWNTKQDGTGTEYASGSIYSENADVTLYAIWSAGNYTIEYDTNGGKNGPEDQNGNIGESITISSTEPTRDGYTFLGWSTDSSATSADSKYAPGKTYSGPDSITLYAVWSINSYTLTIDANGGTVSETSKNLKTNEEYWPANPTPAAGYGFTGWDNTEGSVLIETIPDEKEEGGITVQYYKYKITMRTQNSTIKARYDPLWYTISYNSNTTDTVAGMPASTTGQYTNKLTLSTATPTRVGYTFKGWSTNQNATSGQASGSEFTMPNYNITWYAIWEVNSYTLTYDANGGSGAPSSSSHNYGSSVTLSTTQPTRSGYTFKGWASSSTATSAEWSAGGSYGTMPANGVTIYAVWEQETTT